MEELYDDQNQDLKISFNFGEDQLDPDSVKDIQEEVQEDI